MAAPLLARVRAQWRERQHRDALLLVLNTGLGAAAGFLFWLVLTRVLGVDAARIGTGYAAIAVATIVAVVAKGGLDTAVLRLAPGANHRSAARLVALATVAAAGLAALACLGLALLAPHVPQVPPLGPQGWAVAAAIAAALCAMWIQDAHFLAVTGAAATLLRNTVASAARVALPFIAVLLAWRDPVALPWMLSVAAAVAMGMLLHARLPHRPGRDVRPRELWRTAARNATGSAAEFLPGLILAPLVLATSGPAAAAYFGIAWTIASMLYLVSAALCRSALAQMVAGTARSVVPAPSPAASSASDATVPKPSSGGPIPAPATTAAVAGANLGVPPPARAALRRDEVRPACLRRAMLQHAVLVLPGALGLALLAPWLLAVFGADYAANAGLALAVLALATFAVAPTYLYLALLRAEDRPGALVWFPLGMLVLLGALAPPAAQQAGILGVALAWLAANVPFGAWATWRLLQATKEVELGRATVGRPLDME